MSQPTHKVIIHRHAMAELEQYYGFAWKNGGDQASEWYERFVEQLKSLDRPRIDASFLGSARTALWSQAERLPSIVHHRRQYRAHSPHRSGTAA